MVSELWGKSMVLSLPSVRDGMEVCDGALQEKPRLRGGLQAVSTRNVLRVCKDMNVECSQAQK